MDKDRKWCVYMHISPSNKRYIGITNQNINIRWGKNGHNYLRKRKDGNYYHPVFAKAIKKYGWDNFKHEIVASNLTENEAKRMEESLIALYKTNCCEYKNPSYGYNMTDGGDGATGNKQSEETKMKKSKALKGHAVSEEQREKLRQANIGKTYPPEVNAKKGRSGEKHHMYGKHHTEEAKNKISQGNIGKILSEETKKKISESEMGEKNPFYGKKHTDESKVKMSTSQKQRYKDPEERRKASERSKKQMENPEARQRISEANKGRKHSEETKKKMSEAKMGEKNSNYGKHYSKERVDMMVDAHPNKKSVICIETSVVYRSLREVERITGINYRQVSNCCYNKPHCITAGGYHWMFYNNYIALQEVC